MPLDDEIRERLHREQAAAPRSVDSRAVLSAIGPAMRRARRRRVAGTTLSVAVVLAGGAAVAQVVRDSDGEGIRIASSEAVGGVESPAGSAGPTPTSPTDPATTEVAPPNTTPTTRDPSPATTPTSAAVAPDAAAPTTAPVGATSTMPAPVTPPATSNPTPVTAPPSDTTPPPATSTSTTVATSERFESACGAVLADRSSGVVDIIEVFPAPGYEFRIEDPDEDGVTVQFTGTGEDCELRIPL